MVTLGAEIQKLKETSNWQDAYTDKLDRIKGELHHENKFLEEELYNLKLSKKCKKHAKKDKRRRDKN